MQRAVLRRAILALLMTTVFVSITNQTGNWSYGKGGRHFGSEEMLCLASSLAAGSPHRGTGQVAQNT